MHVLYGVLSWLCGHCWGCRFGAQWRHRHEPSGANRLFISPRFLRFLVVLLALDLADGVFLYAIKGYFSVAAVALVCGVAGLATGIMHGKAEY